MSVVSTVVMIAMTEGLRVLILLAVSRALAMRISPGMEHSVKVALTDTDTHTQHRHTHARTHARAHTPSFSLSLTHTLTHTLALSLSQTLMNVLTLVATTVMKMLIVGI